MGTTIFIIILVVCVFLALAAQDSKKDTTIERLKDAGKTLHNEMREQATSVLKEISPTVEHRQELMEYLRQRSRNITHCSKFTPEYNAELLLMTPELLQALQMKNLSPERWHTLALHFLMLAYIRNAGLQYGSGTYGRQKLLEDEDSFVYEQLKLSLETFNIPEKSWVTYGNRVLKMYAILDRYPDAKKYCFIRYDEDITVEYR